MTLKQMRIWNFLRWMSAGGFRSFAAKRMQWRQTECTIQVHRFRLQERQWTLGFTKKMRKPMVGFTTAVNSIFVFIIIAAYLFGGHEITAAFGLNLLFYIIITPISELESRGVHYNEYQRKIKT